MKPPILWNRLEDDSSVQKSIIGVNGTINGTVSYASGKFGNGLSNNTFSPDNSVTFTNAYTSSSNSMTIEFWWKPTYSSSDANYHTLLTTSTGKIHIFWNAAVKKIGIYLGLDAVLYNFAITFSANQLQHIGAILNVNGGVGQRLKLYQDGNSLSATIQLEAVWTTLGTITFKTCSATFENVNAVVDNLKIYDYVKTNFDDRHDERGGMNDIVRLL